MTENRFYALISRTTPTLVEFYATWCGPCREMQTILEDLERTMRTRADVIRIDTDSPENGDLTRQHRIMSVPTLPRGTRHVAPQRRCLAGDSYGYNTPI